MSKNEEKSYRELQAELDEIMAKLQAADVDVDEATGLYERGMHIVKDLERHISAAENTVKKIKTSFE